MQVSWIDEDELRALTSLLQGAFPEPKAEAVSGPAFPDVNEAVIASLLEGGPLPATALVAKSPAAAAVVLPAANPAPVAAPLESQPAPAPATATALPTPVVAAPQMHVSVITPADEPVGTVTDDSQRPEVAHIRDRLKAIRDRAQAAGLLPPAPEVPPMPVPVAEEPPAAPVWAAAEAQPRLAPDFPSLAQAVASISDSDNPPVLHLPEDGTMAERLEGYTHWAARLTRAEQIILMDDYGDLLWGNPETNDLILTAMLALNASSRSRIPGAPAFLRSQLGQNRELHALSAATRFGTVTLALINPGEISVATTGLLQDGLVKSIEGSVATAHG
ncbi:hypothetical protein [Verrucomicrobium sp. BvORR106]|uniref:hypothetical protein n=1 Tax=Verrucomicrobium sp. BvORR106 TaxID=1403819 RepID=UPI00056FB9A5|nr:hypothetical protein [Verrucomicrobium sp. BvORR106]